MSIYVLRHEQRYGCPKFFTSLTEKGLENSQILIEKIKKLKINHVYCSPFLRTIQTIYPYINNIDGKIKIENSLYEAVKSNTFTKENYLHDYSELFDLNNNFENVIDNNYISFLSKKDIDFPENMDKLIDRIIPFLEYIKVQHKNEQVLLVTHMSQAIIIRDYLLYNEKSITDKDPTGKLFPMGHIEKVYSF